MSFDGFNYEDAIIISEELVRNDTYTSIHIEDFDVEIRETKLGREEFTRDIPNVSEKALRNLDDTGIVQVGTYVKPGDILVGKVSPKSKTELTPEEKLLHAIFGRAGEDVKNDSLEVPSGIEGIVIDTQKFSRRMSLSEDERKVFEKELKDAEGAGNAEIASTFEALVRDLEEAAGVKLKDATGDTAGGRSRSKVHRRASDIVPARSHPGPSQRWRQEEGSRKGLCPAVGQRRDRDRRSRPQAEQHEAWRRAAQRRSADGQGLHCHQARDQRW